MGIKGLIGFLSDAAPGCISEVTLESLSGTSIAIDASTALYQFTIAIREGSYLSSLTNSKGESTSHIAGLLNRCIRLLELGIRPVFVFDSTPPEAKSQTLAKRKLLREEAESSLEKAIEEDDKEAIRKYVGRTVRITQKENESAKKLLRLVGVPVIEAAEEAEAQCAYLCQRGFVTAVGSEDADALVFRCGVLLKNLTASNKPVVRVDLAKALELLELTHEQFTDFCILCGCDYCGTLKGVGPKTAYNLIKKHGSISRILEVRSETLEGYEAAQEYFRDPKVRDITTIDRCEANIDGLREFLISENDFSEERVDKLIERLQKARSKKTQLSLKSFFGYPPRAANITRNYTVPIKGVSPPAVVESAVDSTSDDGKDEVPSDDKVPSVNEVPTVDKVPSVNEVPTVEEAPPADAVPTVEDTSEPPSEEPDAKKRNKRVPIEVDDSLVPDNLKRFICVQHYDPRVTIKRTGASELGSDSVDSLVSHICGVYGIQSGTPDNDLSVVGEGILWPNPILQRFRSVTKDLPNSRLHELWRCSSSHGISWDALDKLYINFREARDSSVEEWDKYAPEIVDFASKVARDKITQWLDGSTSCPPRLLRRWTHLLYSRWRERYLHVYGPRMLSRYLKGEVTDRVLVREINECLPAGVECSELPLDTEPSEHNPHFVRRVPKSGS
ncbi:XPG I nuclease region family protein [Babesia bovis T2Bo]|uniref:Flap endonuclease 1 n=1 Tax=Babesia bovis TaxID=5865 RepID=FEN1_BABBO|nr:XPG I nuclease region family protein [Babesia bovis T2Bo]A7AX58.1 RecName: Full=Flap endonuclease 1; Short=FEN-1; AltName: Full=Flap structure-specific endonuclease 1 [Babesia bovis]EDO05131.1 XPG I nuclease region family protein [Babesia bovis T2Bo]|eukprot:XP_001608699.1 XPG N-terminal domain and XPG I-region domain containing protein [Babesia bovis T2Bo]